MFTTTHGSYVDSSPRSPQLHPEHYSALWVCSPWWHPEHYVRLGGLLFRTRFVEAFANRSSEHCVRFES